MIPFFQCAINIAFCFPLSGAVALVMEFLPLAEPQLQLYTAVLEIQG